MSAVRTIGDVLAEAEDSLRGHGMEEAKREALLMLAYLLGSDTTAIIDARSKPFEEDKAGKLDSWIARRAKREPLQYVIGEVEFRGRDFMVGPGVLIPRPETELLVDEALSLLKDCKADRPLFLDLCTGSGCVAVSLAMEFHCACVLATDVSDEALETTVKNALIHDVIEELECLKGDIFEAVEDHPLKGAFDIIVANPPYIKTADIFGLEKEVSGFEPHLALDGGTDGLRVIRKIIKDAHLYLKPGASLLMEIGFGQGEAVLELFKDVGIYEDVRLVKDYSDIDRIAIARMPMPAA